MRRVISRLLLDTGVSRGRLCSEAWTAPGHICRLVEAGPALHTAGLLCHSTCPLAAEKGGWLLREGSQPARREPRGGGWERVQVLPSFTICVWGGVKCQEGIPRPGLRNQDVQTGMLMSGRKADPLYQGSVSLWALPVVFSMDCSYVDITCNASAWKFMCVKNTVIVMRIAFQMLYCKCIYILIFQIIKL